MAVPISILITGPESSGKSTISKQLNKKLNACLVPEYAREYLSKLSNKYSKSDLDQIIKTQYESEKNALLNNKSFVVLDTGPIVLEIWSTVKYGSTSPLLKNWIKNSKYDFVFLCKPDFTWVNDPLREHPNKQKELFELYEKRLTDLNWHCTVLEGNEIERLEKAMSEILP